MSSSGNRFKPRGTGTAAALLAAILLFLVIGFGFAVKQVQDQQPYLSFSADTDGVKALRELMEYRDVEVREWRKPWVRLLQEQEGLLLAVEPLTPDPKEVNAIREWVEKGNKMILFTRFPGDWIGEGFGIVLTDGHSETGEPFKVQRLAADGYGAGSYLAVRPVTLDRLEAPDDSVMSYEPLLQDDAGVLAARYTVGSGAITLLLTPEWLLNDTIATEEHFELLWPILMTEIQANDGKLLVDEYHHGYHSRSGPLAVYPNWMLAIYIQLALVLLLLLWNRGRRFGPIRTPREWVVRRGDETLLAVSGWYNRGKLRLPALANQEAYMRQLAQERWGVRVNAPMEELLRAARARGGSELERRCAELFSRLELAKSKLPKQYSNKDLLEDTKRMSDIIKVLEKE